MGKSFDLMIFASSANRAALTAVPIVTNDEVFTATTNPVGGIVRDTGHVGAVMVVSETAAALNFRFHHTKDPSWNYPRAITRLQTVQPSYKYFQVCGYPITKGQTLTCEILNAGAVLDSIGLFIDKGGGIASPFPENGKLPKGYHLVDATATMTMIADSIARGTIVFTDFVTDAAKKYHIAGMATDGATGHFTRIKHLSGENVDDHPGVPCSDTAPGLDGFMLYGDFGTFDGQNLFMLEQLAEAADAVVNATFLIKEL